jgi:hypothetical protein
MSSREGQRAVVAFRGRELADIRDHHGRARCGSRARADGLQSQVLVSNERQRKWLFKRCRPHTGEDWAEKVAAEVAALLELPHALVELAEADGERGSICRDFAGHSDLIHGNELLWQLDRTYPTSEANC